MAITASSADISTGTATQPSTKNPKGPATEDALRMCQKELDLPDLPDLEYYPPDMPWPVWYLLYHVDKQERKIRLELSRPLRMDKGRRLNRWFPRIDLRPIDLDGGDLILRSPSDTDLSPSGAIDIPVNRRPA